MSGDQLMFWRQARETTSDTSVLLWPGLPWARQSVIVGYGGGRPAMTAGERGRGTVLLAWWRTVPDISWVHSFTAMTLEEALAQCPDDTAALLFGDAAVGGGGGTLATLRELAALADEQATEQAVMRRVARVTIAGQTRQGTARALRSTIGDGELVGHDGPVYGHLWYVTQGPLPPDLTAARAAIAADLPVPAIYAVAAADLPRWLSGRVSRAMSA